jgi:hypothetical protein
MIALFMAGNPLAFQRPQKLVRSCAAPVRSRQLQIGKQHVAGDISIAAPNDVVCNTIE